MRKLSSGVRFLTGLSVVLTLFAATAAPAAKPISLTKRLDHATVFLRSPKIMKLQVEKTVVSELLGKTTSSTGEIIFGQGKFRWETMKPEKSLVVFDGKTFWTLQEPPKELGGPAQVTRSRIDGKARDQILIKLLSGGKLSSKFKVDDAVPVAGKKDVVIHLSPLKPDPNVKAFSVLLTGQPERLEEIRYTDEVGNQTTIRILDSTTVKKPAADLFKFEAPKGAEVSDL